MDNGFNQMNNVPVQPDPNAFSAQQPYVQPDGGFAQQPYEQPQAGFAKSAYDASLNQQTYGWGSGYSADIYGQGSSAPIKCPGKEITGMVFGIGSVLMGVITIIMGIVSIAVGATFGRHSIYSYGRVAMASASEQVYVYGIVYGLMAIAFAVVAMVLRGKVMAQATEITNKIKAGFGLAIAGIITGGIGLFMTIVGIIMMNA